MEDLNLDPLALEAFAAHLEFNEEAAAAAKAPMTGHNANNSDGPAE